MKTKIVITGAAGFVGSHLLRALVDTSNVYALVKPTTSLWRLANVSKKYTIIPVSLNNPRKLKDCLADISPDYVFHLATRGAYPTQTNAEDMIRSNIIGTYNLLQVLTQSNCQNLIVVGSSSEYGLKHKPMSESDAPHPNTYYGATKLAQTALVQAYGSLYNRCCVVLRLFAVYGPLEEPGRFVRNSIQSALYNNPILLSDGKVVRDFIYIKDIVSLLIHAMKKEGVKGEIINVGTGIQTTLQECASMVVKLAHSHSVIKVGQLPNRSFDSYEWVADTTKMKQLYNFYPKYSLRMGLKETICWYKQNLNLHEKIK